jgi:acetyltransferase-like isoleucine patch superfamily enzyme
VELGSYIHIGGGCFLSARGGISMGDFSGLSQNVSIYSATDDYLGHRMTNPTVPEHLTGVTVAPVAIGRHVILGSGAVVLPGVTLGEGAAVGALSLVNRSLDEWGVYAGSPARLRGPRKRNPLALERELDEVLPAATRVAAWA